MSIDYVDMAKTILALAGISGFCVGLVCLAHWIFLGVFPPRLAILFIWIMLAAFFHWDSVRYWIESGGDQDAEN